MTQVSFLTVALSGAASIVTGYVGVLFNYNRQRQRQRRIYGLALLAEIKALQKLARQYYGTFVSTDEDFESFRLPKLRFSSADTTVFNNVACNVGLFSTEIAVSVIEYYSSVRNLTSQAQNLVEAQANGSIDNKMLREELVDHLHFLRITQRNGEFVVRLLRRETPTDMSEKIRYIRLALTMQWRRFRQRMGRSATPAPSEAAGLVTNQIPHS